MNRLFTSGLLLFPKFISGHASSVLPIDNKTLLLSFFAGSREGADDTRIYTARLRQSEIWETTAELRALKLETGQNLPHWNPVLQRINEREIWLYFKIGRHIASWISFVTVSHDGGTSWSHPSILVPSDPINRGPVRNKILAAGNGTWLAPSSDEEAAWSAFVDYSDDRGLTWSRGDKIIPRCVLKHNNINHREKSVMIPVPSQSFCGRGIIQPTLWEDESRDKHMLLRSSEGCLFRADSTGDTREWGYAYSVNFPNNNSGIDAAYLGGDQVLLAANPIGKNWGARTPMSLCLSRDGGYSFERLIDLDSGEGEYSYPCLSTLNGEIYLSYTWRRKGIRLFKWRISQCPGYAN